MRWEDERYVRLYTRDTPNWLSLSFEAQGLLTLLLRKADRAGIIELGRLGARAVAVVIGHPGKWPKLQAPLTELADAGCLAMTDTQIIFPNFIEAQECQQSDAVRQRESRERRRAEGLVRKQVNGKDAWLSLENNSGPVTAGHSRSQQVTEGHGRSQQVTPSLAVPSLPSLPSRTDFTSVAETATAAPVPGAVSLADRRKKPRTAAVTVPNGGWVEQVWGHHCDVFGGKGMTVPAAERDLIAARLADGRSADELCKAIDGTKANVWRVKRGLTRLTQILESDDTVRVAIGWADNPPDEARGPPAKGRATEADKDWSKPQPETADGDLAL